MADSLGAPPVLSTPDIRLLGEAAPVAYSREGPPIPDEELSLRYEIERTLREIRNGKWRRIALQFPDEMLPDAPRVFQLLSRGLQQDRNLNRQLRKSETLRNPKESPPESLIEGTSMLSLEPFTEEFKLFILGDTSYGSCCVDEIAAEHADAEVVVHYGRSCLSPTARLPVIYCFTQGKLPEAPLIDSFKATFPDLEEKVIIAADVTYAKHVPTISSLLEKEGYRNIFATSIRHDPSSPIPNRTIPISVTEGVDSLNQWQLFHISDPPTSLLLTLSSRVGAIHIYPTKLSESGAAGRPLLASTTLALRRRYAIITSLNTVAIWGILINTLSVKNYLNMVDHVKEQIAAVGKKSYLFVVGKLNAAKVANFSEIGGWVVIGCWESSLVDSKEFYKPVITPFELELTLRNDSERVWTGEWSGDFQRLLDLADQKERQDVVTSHGKDAAQMNGNDSLDGDVDSESESAPPEFDLRTGRYVSHTRPMKVAETRMPDSITNESQENGVPQSSALTKSLKGELTSIGGIVSPGADFLRWHKSWKGLGSDFDDPGEGDENGRTEGTAVTQGRSGIARGYVVGDSDQRH